LICPLNWGLGHAARCIPVVKEIIAQGAEVIIASEENPMVMLQQEFPSLQYINFEGYHINYGKNKNIAFKMFLSIPKIVIGIYKEHKRLNKIINELEIDVVISDNRFGCWNKNVYSIYITHQVMIKSNKYLKFMEGFLYYIHKSIIKKYNECWIPDLKDGNTLSGDLSHKYILPFNYYYIGTLSRFNATNIPIETINYENNLMVILSGPEPQRSIFEDIILSQLKDTTLKVIIVRGKPNTNDELITINNNVTIYPHLSTDDFKDKLIRSAVIISRSGYSTLMDLAVFGKKAILVPTPGQTEQEYLAKYHLQNKQSYYMPQKDFNLKEALINSEGFTGIKLSNDSSLLQERIKALFPLNIL